MARARAPAGDDRLKADLLAGLRQLLDGSPRRLQAAGKNPGAFPAGAGGRRTADRALGDGLVAEVPSPEPHTGRGAAPKYVTLTDAGRRFVLEGDDPRQVLKGLREGLDAQQQAVAARVEDVAAQVERLATSLREQVGQYRASARTLVEALGRSPVPAAAPAAPPPATTPGAWLELVPRLVAEAKQKNSFDRPTLPRVYEEVKKTAPGLTLGQFHDGLRTLHVGGRIRLGGYTHNLATLPDVQNALYLDREVKFYVDLP